MRLLLVALLAAAPVSAGNSPGSPDSSAQVTAGRDARGRKVTTKRFQSGERVTTVRQDGDGSVTEKSRASKADPEVITIRGRRTSPVKLSGATGTTIRFAEGASLVGKGSGNGLEMVSGCKGITVEGGLIERWRMCIRIADSGAAAWDSIVLRNVTVKRPDRQGLLLINSSGVSVFGGTYEAGSDHGIYGSAYANGRASTHIRIKDVTLPGRKGNFLLQFNAEAGKNKAGPVEIINCTIGKSSSERAVNLLGCDPFEMAGGSIMGRIHCNSPSGRSWPTKAKLVSVRWKGGQSVTPPSTLVVVN